MGGQYSKVIKAVTPFKKIQGLSIVEVRAKMKSVEKKFGKSGVYFVSTEIVSSTFELNSMETFEFFRIFDKSGKMMVASMDVWSVATFMSIESMDNKIAFCFKLMDINNDGFLNYDDLFVLIVCVTRGIASFKGYDDVPTELLAKIVRGAFKSTKTLNEDGEISMQDFKAFAMANDASRLYLSSLGTKIAAVDATALVSKRCNLQSELHELHSQMAFIMCEIDEIEEDEEELSKGRGGDAALLQITSNEMASMREKLHSRGGTHID